MISQRRHLTAALAGLLGKQFVSLAPPKLQNNLCDHQERNTFMGSINSNKQQAAARETKEATSREEELVGSLNVCVR